MGRFKYLVDSLASMESLKAKYHIPPGVGLEYCSPDSQIEKKVKLSFQ